MARNLRRTAPAALAAGMLVVALAGCGGGPGPPGYGGVSPSADDEGTSTSPDETGGDDPTADVPFAADTSPDTAEPSGDARLVVTDVRVGARDGFDRVVLDLDGAGTPGWRVGYVDAAADDGSGEPVAVDGDAVLQVRLSGMAMPTEVPDVTEYDGAPVDPDGTSSVEEVVYRFWFEGYTTAFVGVTGGDGGAPLPFRVFALEDPARVVVDVRHAPGDE